MAKKKYQSKFAPEQLQARIETIIFELGNKGAAKYLGVSSRTLRRYKTGHIPTAGKRAEKIVPTINQQYNKVQHKIEKREAEKPKPPPPPPEQWHYCPVYPDYMYANGLFGIRNEERLIEIHENGYVAAWYGTEDIPLEVIFTLDPDNPAEIDTEGGSKDMHLLGICTGNPSPKKYWDEVAYIENSRIRYRFLWTFHRRSGADLINAGREFFFHKKRKEGRTPIKFLGWYSEE